MINQEDPQGQYMQTVDPSLAFNTQQAYPGTFGTGSNKERLSQLIELTNEKETIEEIRYILTGKQVYIDPTTNKKIEIQIEKALLTDYGAQKVIKYFKAYLNKNITLSCFDDKEIKIRCSQFHTHLTFELARNWIDFGLRSRTEHNQIVSLLGNHLRAVFNRSLNGLTLIKTLENTHVMEQRNYQDQQKEGLISSIFRRRTA